MDPDYGERDHKILDAAHRAEPAHVGQDAYGSKKQPGLSEQYHQPAHGDCLRVQSMSKHVPHRPSTPENKETAAADGALGLERLVFFSDAVFAIAITLLALDLRLPADIGALSNAQLLDQLLGNWPQYMAFAISFLAIGTFWFSHHRKFQYIKRCDRGLMFLNLLFLMAIAFVPFPTRVASESGTRTATIFYALTMIAATLLLAAIWRHASHHDRLTGPELDARERKAQWTVLGLTVGLFALSIGLAFLEVSLARVSWFLVVPIARRWP